MCGTVWRIWQVILCWGSSLPNNQFSQLCSYSLFRAGWETTSFPGSLGKSLGTRLVGRIKVRIFWVPYSCNLVVGNRRWGHCRLMLSQIDRTNQNRFRRDRRCCQKLTRLLQTKATKHFDYCISSQTVCGTPSPIVCDWITAICK